MGDWFCSRKLFDSFEIVQDLKDFNKTSIIQNIFFKIEHPVNEVFMHFL